MRPALSRRPLPPAVRTLLRRFRAQRPLRGNSLLVTIFGDSIAPRGGAVTLGSLIRLAAPFGLTERLVRTSVARLASEGWLAASRSGRRSEYRLTRVGAERFAEATRRIYGAHPRGWGGSWTLVLLPAATSRPIALRKELTWLGFGQLTPTLFAHPACSPRQASRWLRSLRGTRDALVLPGASGGAAADRQLAARGWSLSRQARRYRGFIARFARAGRALTARRVDPETAFLVRTLLIHEYRKIHLKDPQLPLALLPADWVGRRAYRLCRGLYGRLFPAAEEHLSECARRLHRSLPRANGAARARFGGITR
jgi:phenylacetic acid degradation operon negative regulatory protein